MPLVYNEINKMGLGRKGGDKLKNKERIFYVLMIMALIIVFHFKRMEFMSLIASSGEKNLELTNENKRLEELNLEKMLAIENLKNEVENLKEELEAYKGFDDAILSNLKVKGFTGDLEDIVLDLQTHSELIPFEGVLGGTMGFYSDKHIHLLTDKWVLAYFEDGHIFGFMLLEYDIKDGEIIWKVIDSYLY